MKHPAEVLKFWFGAVDSPQYGHARDEWFKQSAAFDEEVRARFGGLHDAAAAHRLDDWKATPDGSLALLLVLDQFSRNLFRDSPRAFACDGDALSLAEEALEVGFDRLLVPVQRMFMYMPFQHSEAIERQRRSLELFETLRNDPQTARSYDYAVRHFDVIAKFGRFPHRNSILGRTSTPQELEYLRQPGAGF
jgi:uncharacterized protein (DUF924 family)